MSVLRLIALALCAPLVVPAALPAGVAVEATANVLVDVPTDGSATGAQRDVVPVELADSALEATTKAIAAEIRCPVCRGVSVEESPSDFAREMKAVIREKLAAGSSRQEIRRYFADRYGDWVLLDPEKSGIMLSLWVLPIGVFGLGALGLSVSVRHWLRRPGRSPSDHRQQSQDHQTV